MGSTNQRVRASCTQCTEHAFIYSHIAIIEHSTKHVVIILYIIPSESLLCFVADDIIFSRRYCMACDASPRPQPLHRCAMGVDGDRAEASRREIPREMRQASAVHVVWSRSSVYTYHDFDSGYEVRLWCYTSSSGHAGAYREYCTVRTGYFSPYHSSPVSCNLAKPKTVQSMAPLQGPSMVWASSSGIHSPFWILSAVSGSTVIL